MLLEVLICTIDDRIAQAANVLLPQQPDVCYLVSWQLTQPTYLGQLPQALRERTDVRVVMSEAEGGLAHNRNNALQRACGDILLLADDDVRLETTGLACLMAYFEHHSYIDVVATCAKRADKQWHKDYPLHPIDLHEPPRGYYVSSVELALRHTKRLPRFDERFGLGSLHLASGEEEVFIADCLHAGLRARFIPLHTVTLTNTCTTGTTFDSNAKVRRSKGAVLAYLHGAWGAILRSLKFSLFYRGTLSRWCVLKDLLWGINYITYGRE
ncbi:MAG: glycosyltransferase family A protein [Bacteroidales bacterium]|nr:glycosyltransferase family A protein [Bacteroidales bacterium]